MAFIYYPQIYSCVIKGAFLVEVFPTTTFSHWHFWTWEHDMEEQLIYLSHYHPQVGLHIQETQLFEGYRPCTPL